MPNDNEKLAHFEKAVFAEMEKSAAEILAGVDSYKEEKLGNVQEEELQRAYDVIQRQAAEIRAGFAREITREKLNARQRVLARRRELTEQLFEKAANRIMDFTATEDYRKLLQNLLDSRKERISDLKILVREQDEAMVRAMAVGTEVSVTNQFRLGGLIFVDEAAHRYEDETLDSKLKAAEERFYNSATTVMEGVENLA
ncbi:MAG: V-type ATP synthase subunit E [Candidatus Merdivicinus sp.]|jgi:V/A-type H+-transporting ATPase subunit E